MSTVCSLKETVRVTSLRAPSPVSSPGSISYKEDSIILSVFPRDVLMDAQATQQDFREAQQPGPQTMETLVQKRSHVRKANFSEDELMWLVNVFENTWAVICDPSKTADTNRRKRMMWQKIALDHATRFPDKPRTIDEMKNKLLKLKCEAKADWAKGKITLGPTAPHTEDSEMTLMQYVHQKIIHLCEKYEPESLASLQFPDPSQPRSSPDGPSATNSGSNSGLPQNVKIEYVIDEESSGGHSEDPLPDQWEPAPVFSTSAASIMNGAVSSIPASSSQPASVLLTASPRQTNGNKTTSSSSLLDQGPGYSLPVTRREEGEREVPPSLSVQYSMASSGGLTCQGELEVPPSLSRQASLVSASSFIQESPPVLNSALSYQTSHQSLEDRWNLQAGSSQMPSYMNTGIGSRDFPPSLSSQFSDASMGGGGGEGLPVVSSQTAQPKVTITISPDREMHPPLSAHSSFNGNPPNLGRTVSHTHSAPLSHAASNSLPRTERNYASCHSSGAAAENGCSSPEGDYPLSPLRKRVRLSNHQSALMDEVLELERSTLLIRRENLLLKQEKLKLEVQLLKKQI